uniref:Thioredoxin domain-containing protein n=2 Tax=Clastoptera arizonana TaxID=38151 RepID=A0A1B6CLW5_9HEMI
MPMVMPLPTEDDIEGDNDKRRGDNKHQQSTMLFIGRELCFLFAIGITTYAAVINLESNSSKGPPATPFFKRGSVVWDFYHGELTDALFHGVERDFAFIMYYAPWDAESQAVRGEFEALANQYYKQIYFAAINCWHPGGQCKQTLNKVQKFPKFVAYITHENGIEYKGPRNVEHMSRFLDVLIRPLHRIHNNNELLKLRASHNAVFVGYINFDRIIGGPAYRAIYEAALKLVELNVIKEVTFAVVTSQLTADYMGVDSTPVFRMYLWNETKEYNGLHVGENLVRWVVRNIHQVTVWLTPPGIKSLTLAPYISDGPVLIMFTPTLSFQNYDMLREIALEYYNCQKHQSVSLLARYIAYHLEEKILQLKHLDIVCEKQKSKEENFNIPVQIINQPWNNSSFVKNRKQSKLGWADSICQLGANKQTISTTSLFADKDHLSANSLTKFYWQEICRRHLLSKPPKLNHISYQTPLDSTFTGLACQTNKTVTLLAMDSDENAHFADGLGVDLSRRKDHTAVVLFNANLELLHVLKREVSRQSLVQFLQDYTAGKLERFLRTEARKSRPINRYALPSTNTTNIIQLPEITTGTFQTIVLNNSQNVVVFYHSPYCAFCHGISYVYLTIARLMHNVPDLLFTRLDGESNDLPWEYTVHHYPSILFFPARRKAESRAFPTNLQLTVNNLAQFVLANLNVELRLLGMLDLCRRWNDKQSLDKRRDCIDEVRRSCLNSISDTLTNYRVVITRYPFSKNRHQTLQRLLHRLHYLKTLHLFLGTAHNETHLTVEFLKYFKTESDFNWTKTINRFHDEL